MHHALTSMPGCRLEYLPPYSPDYQPIEQAFSVIKAHLRRQGLSFYTPDAHYYELYLACEQITPEMTWGFFRHAGYV
jgi:transposase